MVIAAVSPAVYLIALACPVGMGLMMFFMAKGMMGGRKQQGVPSGGEQSLADLKSEHARLAEKIEALEKETGALPRPVGSGNGNEPETAERATSS